MIKSYVDRILKCIGKWLGRCLFCHQKDENRMLGQPLKLSNAPLQLSVSFGCFSCCNPLTTREGQLLLTLLSVTFVSFSHYELSPL